MLAVLAWPPKCSDCRGDLREIPNAPSRRFVSMLTFCAKCMKTREYAQLVPAWDEDDWENWKLNS